MMQNVMRQTNRLSTRPRGEAPYGVAEAVPGTAAGPAAGLVEPVADVAPPALTSRGGSGAVGARGAENAPREEFAIIGTEYPPR